MNVSFSYPWYLLLLLLLLPVAWLAFRRPLRLRMSHPRSGQALRRTSVRAQGFDSGWAAERAFRRRHCCQREAASLALRLLIIALVILSIAGLQWVQPSNALSVVFLLDASDSIDDLARAEGVAFIRAALAEMGPDDRAALVLFGADALVERPLSSWAPSAPALSAANGSAGLGEIQSIPTTTHTDVGEAVRLGLALMPTTSQRRLVLLSDGQVNVPGAETAAALAAASGVELDIVPLPARSGNEAWLDAVDVPKVLYEDEEFSVVVRVQSTVEQRALLRLFANEFAARRPAQALVAEEALFLHQGLNSFLFDLSAGEPGFTTFTAQLVLEKDTFYQNNVLGAFALVQGAPRVLIVARPPHADDAGRSTFHGQHVDDAANLVLALERAGLDVERMMPAELPVDLASLGGYAGELVRTVVLVNVPAPAISPRQMEALQAYVRDLGGGLVCVGGEASYGLGGYYRTPLEEMLPVEMTIRDRERMPPLAILFVIDKSGSMDMAASQGSARKVELAKEAILRSLELLHPGDQVGVVAFDSVARWVYPPGGPPLVYGESLSLSTTRTDDPAVVGEQVMTLRAEGGTDIRAGLSAAVAAMEGLALSAVEGSSVRLKHVILLTDGGASQEGLRDLATRLRTIDGTLSVVGVGQDAASFLQPLAMDGGGRYHFTDNPATIPQIFAQETALAQRAYIVEETFYPVLAGRSPILEGIDVVPALYGYVATCPKPAAQVVLAAPQDDPLLAQWQYGLGRAVAWTSDAMGRWGQEWVRWEQFPRFWAQVVRWTMHLYTSNAVRGGAGGEQACPERGWDIVGTSSAREWVRMETQIVDQGEQVHVAVDVVGAEGEYGNDMAVQVLLLSPSPSLDQEAVTLRQTAPGRYEGDLALTDGAIAENRVRTNEFAPLPEGVYMVRIVAVDSHTAPGAGQEGEAAPLSQLTGFVRAYSPEYRSFGTDHASLRRLAEVGGGEAITDPAQAFVHDLDAVRTYTDLWPWLLGAAICLLPLDVGIRRVVVGLADLRRVAAWMRARLPLRALARRFRLARRQPVERAERRQAYGQPGESSTSLRTRRVAPMVRPMVERGKDERAVSLSTAGPQEKEDGTSISLSTTARLLAAKRRVQRRDREGREE